MIPLCFDKNRGELLNRDKWEFCTITMPENIVIKKVIYGGEQMSNRRREAKFKYCQIPDGEDLLAVLGSAGIKIYGLDEVRRTVLPKHFR